MQGELFRLARFLFSIAQPKRSKRFGGASWVEFTGFARPTGIRDAGKRPSQHADGG